MNIHELATYNLDDAVKFHQRLNPVLWGRDEHLLPEVRDKLLKIAADFQEFLGVEDLKVKDITVSGSNAAYSYTKQSDIDLHLVVEMPNDPVYQELFAAKKYQYNTEHDITIGGADVELYVQPDDQLHHSQGIYSIKNSDWAKVPQRKRSQIDDTCVLAKVDDLANRIQSAVSSQNKSSMDSLWNKIKTMRQTGLENHGEFGCENISFKLLRNNGSIGALKSAITAAQDRELSLPLKKRVRYGFSEDVTVTPDGVSASTNMFLNETPIDSVVQAFIKDTVQQLNIEHMPQVVLHNDASWSKQTNSFGQYNPDTQTLHVSLANRHLLDILRTVAHELTHCRQNELNQLPDNAGATGSRWENEANAQAGILMRDFADANPEYFTESHTQAKSLQSSMKTFRAKVRIKDRYNTTAIDTQVVARNYDMAKQLLKAQYGPDSVIGTVTELKENASGYIPKNKKEAAMPQYAMALSVDIKPGQTGREANKLALNTGSNGEPSLLMKTANLQEYQMPQPSQGPGRYRDLENMYSHELTRLELKTHDLDEPGEEDVDEGQLHEDIEDFPIANVRRANGAIGNQRVNTEQAADVLTHAAGMQVSPDMSMRQLVDALKADPAAQQRLRQFVQKNPITVSVLPDGSYHLQDGHHRTFLLNLLGDETVPAVVKEGVAENFADGKNPGRKGLAKRSGVNTKASVSSLRNTAKNSSGEKQRMAHWLANMKAGRAKAKRK